MILLPKNYWEIKKTKNKGQGIFATQEIPKDTIIGDYLGKIIHPEEAIIDEKNIYLMYYDDHAVITPNMKKPSIHLLNNSCMPNSWLYIYKGHTLVFSIKKIKKDEEVTIPYLLPPINKFCKPCPHICKCERKNCTGTMHLSKEKYRKWRNLTDKQSLETKKEKVTFGKNLKKLDEYPKSIPESYIKNVLLILN